jgi:two-component system sensor histidine kinase TtrS
MTLHRWLITHWQVPAFVALLLLGLLLHSWRTSVLVRKRTAQLSSALTERENAQAEIQSLSERMESLHKVTVVGQLSSMVAHELAQPLSVIQYYCESQRDILKNKPINERLLNISRVGIEKALARTRSIVDKVRSYNRGNTSRDDSVDVEASVKRVCATLNAELLRKTSFNVLCKPALSVRADKLELELILSNLLKNALEASNEASHPVVIIEAFPCADQVVVRVENSGKVLSEEDFHRLKTPLLSSKATGLGLGVTIASALAEANGGQIQFKARPEGGLIAVVTLLSAASLPENASRTPTDISRKEF